MIERFCYISHFYLHPLLDLIRGLEEELSLDYYLHIIQISFEELASWRG